MERLNNLRQEYLIQRRILLKNNQEVISLDEEYSTSSKICKEKIEKIIEFFRAAKINAKLNMDKEKLYDLEEKTDEAKIDGVRNKKKLEENQNKESADDIQIKKILTDYYKDINERHDLDKIKKYKEIKI